MPSSTSVSIPHFRLLVACLVAGAMALVCGTAVVPEAHAAMPAVKAVQIGGHWQNLTDAELTRTMDEAAATGANAVRIPIFWSGVYYAARGTLNAHYVSRIDTFFGLARARNLKVLVTLMSTPCWASSAVNGAPCGSAPPQFMSDWTAMVDWLLRRYGTDLSGLEVWNEPNLTSFWAGTPAQYVSLVSAAKQARNRLRSSVPIIAGVLAGSDVTYLKKLYVAGVAKVSDTISVHPYDLSWATWTGEFGDPTVPRPSDPTGSFATGVPAVRELMVANGDSAAKLWLTEFGYATCPALPTCVSEQQAADWTDGALRLASTMSYLGAFTIYSLSDDPTAATDPDFSLHFGLMDANFVPKPAHAVVSRWFRGG